MIGNKELVGMLENLHLLRGLFIRRISQDSPIHFGQIAIMRTIEQNENCTQATIAECLRVTPASVAVSTKRLQKAGLITKTVDQDNLRCKRLSLTEKGREAINQRIKLFDEYDSRIFGCLSDEERDTLYELLKRLAGVMQEAVGIENSFSNPIDLGCLLRSKLEAAPHKDCASDAQSDFSSDCTEMTQAY